MGSRFRLPTSIALAGLVLSGGCSSLLRAGDTASQARQAIDDLSRHGLRSEVGGTPLVLTELVLSEIVVDDRNPPDALFHVQAGGRWGEATLGYYGSERVSFRRSHGSLVAPEAWLPKLEGVLTALTARDAALAAQDAAALVRLAGPENHDGAITATRLVEAARAAPKAGPGGGAISVRIDGERAQVSATTDSPGPRSASLVKLGDSWRFTAGLL